MIFISLGVFKIEMAESLGMETFSLQYIFGFFSIFNMLGIFINKYLLDKVKLKREIVFSSLLSIAGCVGLIFSKGETSFSVSLCTMAMGTGIYFSISNYMVVNMHLKKRIENLNFLHFCYAAASILTPVFAAGFIKLGLSWRVFYATASFLPLIVIVISERTYFVERLGKGLESSGECYEGLPAAVYLAVICLFSYVFSEMVFNYWIVEYLVKNGNNKELSKLAISTFWVAIAVGRFYNSKVASKMSEIRRVIRGSLAGLLAYFLLVNTGSISISFVLVVLMGFFYSGLYAAIVSVGTSEKKTVSSLLMMLLIFSGSLGSISVSPVTGFVKQKYGMDATMYLGVFAIFLVFLTSALYEFIFCKIFKIKGGGASG
jgi:fucose permease